MFIGLQGFKITIKLLIMHLSILEILSYSLAIVSYLVNNVDAKYTVKIINLTIIHINTIHKTQ